MKSTDMAASQTKNFATVEIVPGGPVRGQVRPPGSKSLTNRALICAAFAGPESPSQLRGTLRSEDTEVMSEALRQIGCRIDARDRGRCLDVGGANRTRPSGETISMFIANSGTTIRFLTAALSAHGGRYRLHGVDRMHHRPIADLTDAIGIVIDGQIATESPGGCPPVTMESGGWQTDHLTVRGQISSQYLSGLMLAAPLHDRPVTIDVAGELVSRPYVEMTAQVIRDFGGQVNIDDAGRSDENASVIVRVEGRYQPRTYNVEPDASAASYFWAAAAITRGSVTVQGLTADALQGDVGFVNVLAQMGCRCDHQADGITVHGGPLRGIDVDMNAISDTVQTLAVVALFAEGPTRVRGVAHNRFKETDRIGDLATELRKIGANIDEHEDGLTVHPAKSPLPVEPPMLSTYDDHRMAMSLSLLGLRVPGIRIENPSCTAKTYPEFFWDLERLIGRPHRWSNDA